MADLPDLDTGGISYLVYWNAIDDGGAGEVDPEEVVSASGVNQYTLYDNGVHITDYGGSVPIEARVKTDGWFVAYIPRYANFTLDTGSRSNTEGWWDIANDWWSYDGNAAKFKQNNLERAINELYAELSNSGTISYNTSDVSLYNYQYAGASATTGLSMAADASSGSATFSYTSETDLRAAVAFGGATKEESANSDGYYHFAGVEIARATGGDTVWGSLDLLGTNTIPDAGTEYDISYSGETTYDGYAEKTANAIVLWS